MGDDPGDDEALIDEDGAHRAVEGRASIEPFLVAPGDSTWTWSDADTRGAALESEDMPLVSVTREWRGGSLTQHAFVYGADSSACLYARYEVAAESRPVHGTLVLAIRPFQVNPPAQFLNGTGGACAVRALAYDGHLVRVDDHPPVRLVTRPDAFSAQGFDATDARDLLAPAANDSLREGVDDPAGYATGQLRYTIDLARGATRTIDLVVPLASARAPELAYEAALRTALAQWKVHGLLSRRLQIPGADIDLVSTLEAQLTWARVTNATAPCSSPARAPTSARGSATARSRPMRSCAPGSPRSRKEFATWFAPFVPDDGKVPCCVDARGPDPAPEHDSHGEFIFLVAEIVRYTGDVALAERLWPAVRARGGSTSTRCASSAAPPSGARRRTRRTSACCRRRSATRATRAKPMHSYWDDLWALRGLRDATDLARRLGHAAEARHFAASRDTFAADLGRSVHAAMAAHAIDYVPGCADLGDFDATSTTIALDPVDARGVLPPGAVERTFERYWSFFLARRDSGATWDAYTPYELRTVGAMARLGWRDRAAQALAWFFRGLSPAGFRTWPEVVDRDPRHERFIGDMPHTWVGTDGVRAGLDLVAYVSGEDSALVLGAGIPAAWLKQPVMVRELPTPFGPLSYSMAKGAGSLDVRVGAGLRVPTGGVRIWPPATEGGPWRQASIDGAVARLAADGSVVVRRVPAVVRFTM